MQQREAGPIKHVPAPVKVVVELGQFRQDRLKPPRYHDAFLPELALAALAPAYWPGREMSSASAMLCAC
jgi:hypothetical protein